MLQYKNDFFFLCTGYENFESFLLRQELSIIYNLQMIYWGSGAWSFLVQTNPLILDIRKRRVEVEDCGRCYCPFWN